MELAALLVLSITSGRDEIVKLFINHGGVRSFVIFFRIIYLILYIRSYFLHNMLHYFYPELETLAYYFVSLLF